MKYQSPYNKKNKINTKYKKRVTMNHWLHYTDNRYHYQKLWKQGSSLWSKKMSKKMMKTWIRHIARYRAMKTRIASRIYNATKKNGKRVSLLYPEKMMMMTRGKIMMMTGNASTTTRIYHYIQLKHMLQRLRIVTSSSSSYRKKTVIGIKHHTTSIKKKTMGALRVRLMMINKTPIILTRFVMKRKKVAMLAWMSYMKARKRLLSTVTLEKKGMVALARKHTLFLRWRRLTKKGINYSTLMIILIIYANDNVYIGCYLAGINRESKIHSRKRILSSTFTRLKEKMMIVAEEDRTVKKFYQRIIAPMKLQRGFDALYALWDRKNVFEADPRYITIHININITINIIIIIIIIITITITINITIILIIRIRLHDHNLVETYLYQWRDNYYYEKDLRDKVNSYISIRGIVNEMSAVNIWRSFTTDMHHYHTCNRRADKFRKMVSSSSTPLLISSSSSSSSL